VKEIPTVTVTVPRKATGDGLRMILTATRTVPLKEIPMVFRTRRADGAAEGDSDGDRVTVLEKHETG
jgi:hypothetical protein